MKTTNRREFLKESSKGIAGIVFAGRVLDLDLLQFVRKIDNPLAFYPDRDWENVYRNQYRYDRTFTYICAPNDTHNCRLRAFVRNGIVVRIEQNYDATEVTDVYGNRIPPSWNPRGCLKGYTYVRRMYGPYRVKYPMIRKGWKEWADVGFPADANGVPNKKYFRRGEDSWLRISWDEASTYAAKGLLNTMRKYEGEEGARRLRAQGYPEEMIEAMHGSGGQVVKIRPGMSLHGVLRLQALKRFANMLALHDEAEAKKHHRDPLGARSWSNYDWHGDLPPGHPMVTGIQTHDDDHNNFRHARLFIIQGVNFVENKMSDAHWWIRPGTDPALQLGVTNILIKEKLYHAPFVKRFTDMPLLVRLDTLKLLRASDIFKGYKNKELKGYSVSVQKIDPEAREQWGDFVVWDAKTKKPVAMTREDVGKYIDERGLDPTLEGSFTLRDVQGKELKVKTVFQLYKELCAEYDLKTTHEITGAPEELIVRLARDLGTIKPAAVHTGEGVHHYFHCDLTTRGTFLWMALTGNIGKAGSGVGHWAGNYKFCVFDGLPKFNRTFSTGIGGTPMPGYGEDALIIGRESAADLTSLEGQYTADEIEEVRRYAQQWPSDQELARMTPEQRKALSDERRWALVYYVLSLAQSGKTQISYTTTDHPVLAAAVENVSSFADPLSSQWQRVKQTALALISLWQRDTPTDRVTVKAVADEKAIAFRLEWEDATKDDGALFNAPFGDAAAIQFPLDPASDPFFGMGDTNFAVNIWQWKSWWEKDMAAFAGVNVAFPFNAADFYPFDMSGKSTVEYFASTDSAKSLSVTWNAEVASGNLLSTQRRISPVEDLNSRGFGTVTSQPVAGQDVNGKGIWTDGRWHVVISRSLITHDKNDVVLKKGMTIPIAFAVWDGALGDRNGQKMVTNWYRLIIQKE